MQKMSAGRGKAIQKILNAVFLSPNANKAWSAAAAGTAGYMVGSDVLNETIAPAVQKMYSLILITWLIPLYEAADTWMRSHM